jgi:hypothetical protein
MSGRGPAYTPTPGPLSKRVALRMACSPAWYPAGSRSLPVFGMRGPLVRTYRTKGPFSRTARDRETARPGAQAAALITLMDARAGNIARVAVKGTSGQPRTG